MFNTGKAKRMKTAFNDIGDPPSKLGYDGFSVDVLVYCPKINAHTVGFYSYKQNEWHYLCNEQNLEAPVWRYFIEGVDTPKNINNEI